MKKFDKIYKSNIGFVKGLYIEGNNLLCLIEEMKEKNITIQFISLANDRRRILLTESELKEYNLNEFISAYIYFIEEENK